ncbi:unnamed protein product, partial [Trichobilharzia regenti]
MRGLVERGVFTYGLSAGCKPKCDINPCLNRGECVEYYSHYLCECGLTPYRGFICGRHWIMRQTAGNEETAIKWTLTKNLEDLDFADDMHMSDFPQTGRYVIRVKNDVKINFEIGGTFNSGPMVKILLGRPKDRLGTVEEYIQVGFKTKSKRGILMEMRGEGESNYIIIKVNNNGGITIEFDVGFKRYE